MENLKKILVLLLAFKSWNLFSVNLKVQSFNFTNCFSKSQEELNSNLIKATINNNAPKVESLIKAGADVNVRDSHGQTSLMKASIFGYENIVKLLIDNKVNVIVENNLSKSLIYASRNGHESIVRLLIESGADVNATDHRLYTGLSRASMNGHESIVRLLIEGGANVNARWQHGDTALALAERKRLKVANLLKDIIAVEEGKSSFEDQPDIVQETLALRWLNQGEFKKLAKTQNGSFYTDLATIYIALKSGTLSSKEIIKILDGSHHLSICLKSKELPWTSKLIKLIEKLIVRRVIPENRNKEKEAYIKLRSKVKQIESLASKLSLDVASKIVLEY